MYIRARDRDFELFWVGQVVSSLGSSFTGFAIPLLVFALTGSAFDLGLATAATEARWQPVAGSGGQSAE